MDDIDIKDVLLSIPGLVYWKNREGVILGANASFLGRFCGDSKNQLIGKTDFDLPWRFSAAEIVKNDQSVMQTRSSAFFVERGAGFLTHKSAIIDKNNQVQGVINVITGMASYRQFIDISNNMIEDIVASLPGHIFWKDRNCMLIGCNNEQAKNIGLKSRHDIYGKTDYDILSSDQPEHDRREQARKANEVDKEIMDTGLPRMVEEEVVLPGLPKKTFLARKIPLKNKDQETIGLVGISLDITDRKVLEKMMCQPFFGQFIANP